VQAQGVRRGFFDSTPAKQQTQGPQVRHSTALHAFRRSELTLRMCCMRTRVKKRCSEQDVARLVTLPSAAATAAKRIPDALKARLRRRWALCAVLARSLLPLLLHAAPQLPPDNQAVRQAALVGALQPSQDMMATILGSPELVEVRVLGTWLDDAALMECGAPS
jgi:hypothetical protein